MGLSPSFPPRREIRVCLIGGARTLQIDRQARAAPQNLERIGRGDGLGGVHVTQADFARTQSQRGLQHEDGVYDAAVVSNRMPADAALAGRIHAVELDRLDAARSERIGDLELMDVPERVRAGPAEPGVGNRMAVPELERIRDGYGRSTGKRDCAVSERLSIARMNFRE